MVGTINVLNDDCALTIHLSVGYASQRCMEHVSECLVQICISELVYIAAVCLLQIIHQSAIGAMPWPTYLRGRKTR